MRRSMRIALGLLCLALVPAALGRANDEGVKLAWKFKAGDTFRYAITQEMSQDVKSGTMPVKIDMKLVMDVAWALRAVDAEGVASLSQTIDRVRLQMNMPPSAKIDYDSASDKQPEGLGKAVPMMFQAMLNKPMSVKMTPQGKIVELTLPPEMITEMGKSPMLKPMAKIFTPEGIQGLTGISGLPKEAIVPGKTWTDEAVIENPVFGKQKVVSSYSYIGPKTVDGKPVEEIDALVTMSFAAGADQTAKISIKEQDTKRVVYFDNAAGRVSQTKTTTKTKMSIALGGQSIETDMGSTTRFELVPPAAVGAQPAK
jgi:hypothetical protein